MCNERANPIAAHAAQCPARRARWAQERRPYNVLTWLWVAAAVLGLGGCAGGGGGGGEMIYDTTAAKAVEPRDALERIALERGPDLRLVDKLMDKRTRVPEFDRVPLPAMPEKALIADGLAVLSDDRPFPDEVPLPPKPASIRVGVARSTYRTRTREEVLSAIQPFIDLVQRQVNVRGAAVLHEAADELHYALLDGRTQMAISHVFDYLLVRSWFENEADNATVLLAWAGPANPRTGELDRALAGVAGTSIELVVAADARYQTPADLKGARLALVANVVHGPGAFLTRVLSDLGHPLDQRFFSSVALRRYSKDAVIDLLKGKADVACVEQGAIGALDGFYGLGERLRTIAVSGRFNMDVLFTSQNNIASHRTEIELTQNQLTTLGKDPEGQEVLFFFDIERWHTQRAGDIAEPRRYFADYLTFIDNTPADLRVLLDPAAPVDRQTYDRYGDE